MAGRLIVTSQEDIAGSNIFKTLPSLGFRERGSFEGRPVLEKGRVTAIATTERQTEAEHLDEHFSPQYYVFASRHKSESSTKTLTAHTPGNLTGEASVGGKPRELAFSQPQAQKVALKELFAQKEELGLDYKVSLETTHHGPTSLLKPVVFVEVGSSEEEWRDERAVLAVARAALKAAECQEDYQAGIGAGGNHYAPMHTRVVEETPFALGHLIPTYAIEGLDFSVFRQAVEKSGASFAYLDWKGMRREHREKILGFCSRLSLPVKKGRELRMGEGARELELDLALFSEAEKTGGENLRAMKKELEIERNKGGGAVKVSSPTRGEEEVTRAALEDLKAQYRLRVEDGKLLLTSTALDPEKARALGLKPGPDFSRLAGGKSVRAKGKEITPAMVTTEKTKKIRLSPGWEAWVEENV